MRGHHSELGHAGVNSICSSCALGAYRKDSTFGLGSGPGGKAPSKLLGEGSGRMIQVSLVRRERKDRNFLWECSFLLQQDVCCKRCD